MQQGLLLLAICWQQVWSQAGPSGIIILSHYQLYSQCITSCWVASTWKFCSEHTIQIEDMHQNNLVAPFINNIPIMIALSQQWLGKQSATLNLCQQTLDVYNISKMLTYNSNAYLTHPHPAIVWQLDTPSTQDWCLWAQAWNILLQQHCTLG